MIVFHFILNRLVPVIEPILTKARYSYRIHNHRDVELFNRPPTKNWLDFKTDIKAFFNENSEYNYLVSTDVAGFFEYIQLQHFKRQLLNLTRNEEKQTIELLNSMLKEFHRGSVSGIPQNCDPFSYLCTAFLHYLDKELEIRGIKHFRYVDDIKVACKTENDSKQVIITIIHLLRQMNLNLNAAKTEILKKGNTKYIEFTDDFPHLLSIVDKAINTKSKDDLEYYAQELVELTKDTIKNHEDNDRLFRACINRLRKIYRFKNINKPKIDYIVKKCLYLMESKPLRSKNFLSFISLDNHKKYVQDGLFIILKNCIYSWQEMWIWNLLIQSPKIKNERLMQTARVRSRDDSYDEAARNFVYLFLGKHGDNLDRKYISERFNISTSFREKRAILIAIQEYPENNMIYNLVTPERAEPILVSLVKYIKQLTKPEYVYEDSYELSLEEFY